MTDDAVLATEIATAAGELLLTVRAAEADALTGRELGRHGDRAADAFILGRLAAERPADAVLSEESADDPARVHAKRVWIVDPLDGSKEYGMPDHEDWAVHIALWEAGRGITAAAVAQPAVGAVYGTADVGRAELRPLGGRRPRIVVSGSRPPVFVADVARALGADVVRMGSAGAKAMAVVRGDVDAYVHAGGQWEWDSAAPVGVAQAAGLYCARIDGSELEYNRPHPYMPDLVICRPDWAPALMAAIAEHAGAPTDSARVAMARSYIRSLVSHDASHVRLAADAWRVENGVRTGDTGVEIRDRLEHGPEYRPIRRVRELTFREWDDNVVARFLLDLDAGDTALTVAVTEHFAIPAGEIRSIVAIIEPHEHK
ncbi:3'(2'),5'-bisphosphate nucleotidase CysQ [Rhodococcus ruber]|uniref:3'(2'),5'-bisphosphate nucleotidase CysQ n=1 Tax=Rhodococcus TaxID=1827 RepID=UPI00029B0A75|nr:MULTISPECIES: 3'(2'),5'-bisphosphate nucleotidase CysQ [Rhodococcus]MDO2379088.1 3'(2'),5'-bisphosphate nucleotidase CysQ [Rhodococcus ruber]RIK08351.1 MAG: 3'(2'),5'-bisphosphate nucleotidase CysQ [Acidobacteriota bacterium]ATQ31689.1 3'(2'),5'-bisphosphate nucleotidase CysQ [Rhodococcus ruber]AUM15778.1 3'(2'),5'-bisphosphate nucleotidase CysQ [Rhodococcus ruber]AXY51549.1 2', 3'-cyclic nucleotide 2'-phosphodiesterase [Rhodococcus ruber]